MNLNALCILTIYLNVRALLLIPEIVPTIALRGRKKDREPTPKISCYGSSAYDSPYYWNTISIIRRGRRRFWTDSTSAQFDWNEFLRDERVGVRVRALRLTAAQYVWTNLGLWLWLASVRSLSYPSYIYLFLFFVSFSFISSDTKQIVYFDIIKVRD